MFIFEAAFFLLLEEGRGGKRMQEDGRGKEEKRTEDARGREGMGEEGRGTTIEPAAAAFL